MNLGQTKTQFEFKCKGEIFEWRGPSPFYFVALDTRTANIVKERARELSYGWGVIHIHGEIKKSAFDTAMIPKDGTYFIPIKDAIRKKLKLELEDRVTIHFNLGKSTKK